MRVAEPGVVITPPTSSPNTESIPYTETKPNLQDEEDNDEDNEDEDNNSPNAELSAIPEFNSGHCLFCDTKSNTFEDNLAHMTKTHSFTIPHQDELTVDFETIIEYLHMVIYGYGECILCTARRSTVQGIQHHMTGKGHCRFNVVSDIAEFYNMPAQEYEANGESLRLPSGRLLSHGKRASNKSTLPSAAAKRQQANQHAESIESALVARTQDTQLIPTQNDNNIPIAPPSTQSTQLTRGDQQSLAHLADYQVRSLIATSVKHIDQSRREETNAKLRLEKAGNITLSGHFRADTSKRFRGPWG